MSVTLGGDMQKRRQIVFQVVDWKVYASWKLNNVLKIRLFQE